LFCRGSSRLVYVNMVVFSEEDHILIKNLYELKDVSELKQRLIEAWSAMQQCVIDKSIEEWRKCLRFCISAKGGDFEHKL